MKQGVAGAVRVALNILFFAALAGTMYLCYAAGGGITAEIILVISYVFSLVLMPALHEAGHLLFGMAAGFRLVEIRFSFIRILRDGHKLSFRFVNPLLSDTAGYCRMYPTESSGMGARFAWFIAGGVLVQAVYIVLALALSFALNLPMVWATLGISAVYACYLFLLNILPFEGKEGEYDGALLWGLCRREPSAQTFVALLTVQGQMSDGKTPGETDEKLLSGLPQLPEDDPNFSRLQYYRYLCLLDRGEKETAVKNLTRLEDCLDYILSEDRLSVFAELTYAYAFLIGDRQMAECYHACMERESNGVYAADGLRAKTAYALLAGNEARAEELAKEYRRAIACEPLKGMRRFEEKLFKGLYGG